MKTIGITQRYHYLEDRQEMRTVLDVAFSSLFEEINANYRILPHSNHIERYLTELDGIVLSGGNDISHYDDSIENSTRDTQEQRILEYAISHNIPVCGLCRGMLFINIFFGGTIKKIDSGKSDHVAVDHELESTRVVNSYHNWEIDSLGTNLHVLDRCKEDLCIEKIESSAHKILALMWHPERGLVQDYGNIRQEDITLLKEFFLL